MSHSRDCIAEAAASQGWVTDAADFIAPAFYVQHPDGSFTKANPQPSLRPAVAPMMDESAPFDPCKPCTVNRAYCASCYHGITAKAEDTHQPTKEAEK